MDKGVVGTIAVPPEEPEEEEEGQDEEEEEREAGPVRSTVALLLL